MMKILRHLTCGMVLACVGLLGSVQAVLDVDITQGQIKPTPIAVTNFVDESGSTMGKDIAAVITNDLESSGLFIPINPVGFNQTPDSIHTSGPRFADWRMLNAQCLLAGTVQVSGGKVTVQFRLYDVYKGSQMLGLELSVDEKKWRRLAHMIADEVYKRVTGEEGYFNTLVAHIDESGPLGKGRVKRLTVMDYDGEGVHHITDGKEMVMTPRFSPNNRDIAYLRFKHKEAAQVYLHNLATGEHKLLGKFEGMSFAPRFSPDATELVMSLEKGGTSAIYIKDLKSGGKPEPLTLHECIDTSPCFSHDGTQIVFTSDRGGTEQLYVMDRNGDNPHRISFGGGKYSQPVWSPRGDLIAFTKSSGGHFYIGVMKPDGSEERLITDGYLVEAPTWSPNGRVIMFTKEHKLKGGRVHSKLYAIDLTGRGLHEVKTKREATDCSWSQLLDRTSSTPASKL